jgi:hypothetical protein
MPVVINEFEVGERAGRAGTGAAAGGACQVRGAG